MAGQLEQDFQARIARAKEAARLASIAATARASASQPAGPSPTGVASGSASFAAGPPPPPTFQTVPEDVKHRIERLVEFIQRNGAVFEQTARERERGNADFAFLESGAPFNDYFQWRKWQACGRQVSAPPPPAQAPRPETIENLSVGAMANVCRLARARGVSAYAPIPADIVANVDSLPPVEPARLEIRLADFYRDA